MLQRPRGALALFLLCAVAGLCGAQALRELHQLASGVQLLVNATAFDDGDWVQVNICSYIMHAGGILLG